VVICESSGGRLRLCILLQFSFCDCLSGRLHAAIEWRTREASGYRGIAVSPPHGRTHLFVNIQIEGQMMKFIPKIDNGAVQFPVDNRHFTQAKSCGSSSGYSFISRTVLAHNSHDWFLFVRIQHEGLSEGVLGCVESISRISIFRVLKYDFLMLWHYLTTNNRTEMFFMLVSVS
jgi:hypothetical protein